MNAPTRPVPKNYWDAIVKSRVLSDVIRLCLNKRACTQFLRPNCNIDIIYFFGVQLECRHRILSSLKVLCFIFFFFSYFQKFRVKFFSINKSFIQNCCIFFYTDQQLFFFFFILTNQLEFFFFLISASKCLFLFLFFYFINFIHYFFGFQFF